MTKISRVGDKDPNFDITSIGVNGFFVVWLGAVEIRASDFATRPKPEWLRSIARVYIFPNRNTLLATYICTQK